MSEVVGPSGFWSYVHKDNVGSKGRILRLADEIAAEYSLITGQDLKLFTDNSSVQWGDEWNQKIDVALQETTFFIPVVTPRYFASQACRDELLKFSGYARSLGADELLLPIYYVSVEDLNTESDDETKALIAKTQYQNWRMLRLAEESSAEYAQGINAMAVRLAEISEKFASRPTLTPAEVAGDSVRDSDVDGDDDDEPGVIDLIVQLEEAMPRWLETLQALPAIMSDISEITVRTTDKVTDGDQQGKGFGYRVVVAREMAAEIDDPAERLKRAGERYAVDLLDMDPGVRALISLASEPDRSEEERDGAFEFFDALTQVVVTSRENKESLTRFAETLKGPARQFRDLRPGMKKIESGLRSVMDAQAILEEWSRLIDNSPFKRQ